VGWASTTRQSHEQGRECWGWGGWCPELAQGVTHDHKRNNTDVMPQGTRYAPDVMTRNCSSIYCCCAQGKPQPRARLDRTGQGLDQGRALVRLHCSPLIRRLACLAWRCARLELTPQPPAGNTQGSSEPGRLHLYCREQQVP